VENTWPANTLLSEVNSWIAEQSGEANLLLSISHPRKVYEKLEQEKTALSDIPGFGSKGVLIAQRGIATEMKQDTTPYVKPGVLHVASSAEYEKAKGVKGRLVVVDFSAEWCGPCQKIAPIYESLAASNPSVTFIHVDVDKVQVADAQDVSGIPTFKFFKNGSLLFEFSGADASQLQDCVAKYK
jgi:thiol-disulfide isomerase/thioredoxin